ncbi:MAG: histidine phosphatase family protein [Spirochaetes bacterium]|uniref:Histidine phosphatase family protein n=1 Tax=Candidatus Ornithospirochaeta stercoripullorum TaxID=2840899 RepID=A0A9D9H559_9SPIO|nr:histidine phosphatase family protein [Candidatus Ornithospirochaeta stercoripullorum]
MSFVLTLVRHGESTANVRHMLSGWLDVDLTDHGRAELNELKEKVLYPQSDIYFSSSLKRCVETCHILFPDKVPIIDDKFKEVNFHSMEGWVLSTKEEIDSYFQSWVSDEAYLDEETLSDVKIRGARAILETVEDCYQQGLSSATIVMHSGIMRAAIIELFNLPEKQFNEMTVPNGLGYVLSFSSDLSPLSFYELHT